MNDKITIVFDVDDTILNNNGRDYANATPNLEIIDKIRRCYYNLDYAITLYSSRGMISCNGDIEKIVAKNKSQLEKWLEDNEVPYDNLVFGKPLGDLYVDDKCIDAISFVNSGIGPLRGGGSMRAVHRLGNLVRKTFATEEQARDYVAWVDVVKTKILVPQVTSVVYNKVFMEYIDGMPMQNVCGMSDVNRLVNIIYDLSDISTLGNTFDVNICIDKMKLNDLDDMISAKVRKCSELMSSSTFKTTMNAHASFCHGDFTLSNMVRRNDGGGIYLIDALYDSRAASYLLDIAKLRISFCDYEFMFDLGFKTNSTMLPMYDNIIKTKCGADFDVILILQYMHLIRMYRYKDDEQKPLVINMLQDMEDSYAYLFSSKQ